MNLNRKSASVLFSWVRDNTSYDIVDFVGGHAFNDSSAHTINLYQPKGAPSGVKCRDLPLHGHGDLASWSYNILIVHIVHYVWVEKANRRGPSPDEVPRRQTRVDPSSALFAHGTR